MFPDRALPTLLICRSVDAYVRVIRMPAASALAPRGHAVTSNRAPLTHGLLRLSWHHCARGERQQMRFCAKAANCPVTARPGKGKCAARSEEHTSELQSLMRRSYAVFC